MKSLEKRRERLRKVYQRTWWGWILEYFKRCLFLFIGFFILFYLEKDKGGNLGFIWNPLITAVLCAIPMTIVSYRTLGKMKKKIDFKQLLKDSDKKEEKKDA